MFYLVYISFRTSSIFFSTHSIFFFFIWIIQYRFRCSQIFIHGLIHPAYNPYFSACFSARTVFFCHTKSGNSVFLISTTERGHTHPYKYKHTNPALISTFKILSRQNLRLTKSTTCVSVLLGMLPTLENIASLNPKMNQKKIRVPMLYQGLQSRWVGSTTFVCTRKRKVSISSW
jgi:hypothetical protein